MSEREGFVRAIAEKPEDEGLHLIYADWLDDHGYTIEAAIIRFSFTLENELTNTERLDTEYKVSLLQDHPTIRDTLVPGIYKYRFNKGLLRHILITERAFRDHAEKIFATHPIDSVSICHNPLGEEALVQSFANRSVWSRIRHLNLSFANLVDATLLSLLSISEFKPYSLGLEQNCLAHTGEYLPQWQNGKNIKILDLSDNWIRNIDAHALLQSDNFQSLEIINLSGCWLEENNPEILPALRHNRHLMPHLQGLWVNRTHLSYATRQEISTLLAERT